MKPNQNPATSSDGREFVQCPINISEGCSTERLSQLSESVRSALLADVSPDADHNRTVFTLVGDLSEVEAGARELAHRAVELLDIRLHSGVHPRLGVVDVVPFVPWQGVTLGQCADAAVRFAEWAWSHLEVPSYLYEAAAREDRPSQLPEIRRLADELQPDIGTNLRHETAGAMVVGARRPLIAWNIELEDGSLQIAKTIAAQIRADRKSVSLLHGVRAIGLWLESSGIAQVSMNLTETDTVSMPTIYRYVQDKALEFGVKAGESEVIGLVPKQALSGSNPQDICWSGYRPEKLVEYWMKAEPPRRE